MKEPDFTRTDLPLSQAAVTVIGLGLMGASLAQALQGRCRRLTGFDPDPDTRAHAARANIVDMITADPAEALSGAQVIILAAPIRGILTWIDRLTLFEEPAFVFDLGSTKIEICRALAALPSHLAPVGGHPMCGKERGGIAHADPALYHNAPFAWVKLPNSTAAGCQLAESLSHAVGAHPLWIDAETHDRWTAATSHTPYLVSAALAQATPSEAAPLIGPGFRSTARLAGSSPAMMADILETNRARILEALRRVKAQVGMLEDLMEKGETGPLRRWLAEAHDQYDLLLS